MPPVAILIIQLGRQKRYESAKYFFIGIDLSQVALNLAVSADCHLHRDPRLDFVFSAAVALVPPSPLAAQEEVSLNHD